MERRPWVLVGLGLLGVCSMGMSPNISPVPNTSSSSLAAFWMPSPPGQQLYGADSPSFAPPFPQSISWKAGPLTLLPDGAPVWSGQRQLWSFLAQPVDGEYGHGILGDTVEAKTLVVVDSDGNEQWRKTLEPGTTAEALYPIWAPVDGSGLEQLSLTVANADHGAQLRVYDGANGKEVVRGATIGRGYRWQQTLAWFSVPSYDRPVLALIRTPHIGGIVMLFEMRGGDLVELDRLPGFSTHKIGSRNLKMGAVYHRDQGVEIRVPNQNYTGIYAIPVAIEDGRPVLGRGEFVTPIENEDFTLTGSGIVYP